MFARPNSSQAAGSSLTIWEGHKASSYYFSQGLGNVPSGGDFLEISLDRIWSHKPYPVDLVTCSSSIQPSKSMIRINFSLRVDIVRVHSIYWFSRLRKAMIKQNPFYISSWHLTREFREISGSRNGVRRVRGCSSCRMSHDLAWQKCKNFNNN